MTLGNLHDIALQHSGVLDPSQLPSGIGGLGDLIVGNDQDFASSLGNWTNTGGTMTRDTGYQISGTPASLKFAATANTHRIDLPIDGTFLASTDYWIVFFLSNEATTGNFSATASFGLIGTDVDAKTIALGMDGSPPYSGNGSFIACALHWRPTADRTGVSFRFLSNEAVPVTWHIGRIQAWRTPIVGSMRVGSGNFAFFPSNSQGDQVFISNGASNGGMYIQPTGNTAISSRNQNGYLEVSEDDSEEATAYLTAYHSVGDLVELGVHIVVGSGIGCYIGGKNSTTVQFYGDANLDFEFTDGSSRGWGVRTTGGIFKRFATMEERKGSGTATITSAATSIAVTHGAGYTPAAQDIHVVPTNSPTNDPGNWWVSTIGATQFTINIRNVPGASTATFSWRVDR